MAPSCRLLDRLADALGADPAALVAAEKAVRGVDAELEALLAGAGVGEAARAELLALAPVTRAQLAADLRRRAPTRTGTWDV